jgi:hypothetical protein
MEDPAMSEFWKASGGSVVTGAVAILAMISGWMLEVVRRRVDGRAERGRWIRDRRVAAIVDVLSTARSLRAKFEGAVSLKTLAAGAVQDDVESAYTEFRRAIDVLQILPNGEMDAGLRELSIACTALTIAIRTGKTVQRDTLRTAFDQAIERILVDARIELGDSRKPRQSTSDILSQAVTMVGHDGRSAYAATEQEAVQSWRVGRNLGDELAISRPTGPLQTNDDQQRT